MEDYFDDGPTEKDIEDAIHVLLEMELISMSVNEDGEFVFFMTEAQKKAYDATQN